MPVYYDLGLESECDDVLRAYAERAKNNGGSIELSREVDLHNFGCSWEQIDTPTSSLLNNSELSHRVSSMSSTNKLSNREWRSFGLETLKIEDHVVGDNNTLFAPSRRIGTIRVDGSEYSLWFDTYDSVVEVLSQHDAAASSTKSLFNAGVISGRVSLRPGAPNSSSRIFPVDVKALQSPLALLSPEVVEACETESRNTTLNTVTHMDLCCNESEVPDFAGIRRGGTLPPSASCMDFHMAIGATVSAPVSTPIPNQAVRMSQADSSDRKLDKLRFLLNRASDRNKGLIARVMQPQD